MPENKTADRLRKFATKQIGLIKALENAALLGKQMQTEALRLACILESDVQVGDLVLAMERDSYGNERGQQSGTVVDIMTADIAWGHGVVKDDTYSKELIYIVQIDDLRSEKVKNNICASKVKLMMKKGAQPNV